MHEAGFIIRNMCRRVPMSICNFSSKCYVCTHLIVLVRVREGVTKAQWDIPEEWALHNTWEVYHTRGICLNHNVKLVHSPLQQIPTKVTVVFFEDRDKWTRPQVQGFGD